MKTPIEQGLCSEKYSLEGFEKPTERINFEATEHKKHSLHGINEHLEHRLAK